MPLGVLLLDHFADRIPLLELDCSGCHRHRVLRTAELTARYSRFVSLPELKQIALPDCPRPHFGCKACFPQLERLFGTARVHTSDEPWRSEEPRNP
jgi:hypothetical protein